MNKLADEDLPLIDQFIGVVLDRYKAGLCTVVEGAGDIAHLIAAIDRPEEDDHRAYMLSVIASIVLDRYRAGLCTVAEGTGDIAHLIAAIDRPEEDDHRAYMLSVIASKDS